jgi:DNA-binding transcriptional ArsR family regulator
MREVSEWDELKTFFDRRLIKAIGHPVREHILAVLNERIASAREISDEIGADVSSFYHHMEELEKLECIERVETKRRRGAREHFFRAKTSLFFDDAAWRQLPSTFKEDQTVSTIQFLFDDVVGALKEGTFNARDDRHTSWTPGYFDVQGWTEAMELMNRTVEHLGAIREAAASRMTKTGEQGIPATLGILGFETPRVSGNEAASERSLAPEQAPRQA